MKTSNSLLIVSCLFVASLTHAESALPAAWLRLAEGNARFAAGTPVHPRQDAARRAETAAGQKPFAVIVGCADSRNAPEIIFDQGLGDLFVVRLAGNIVDEAALGSIEFAVGQLGARFILVMGHEKCGAVMAAVDAVKGASAPPGQSGKILEAIRPAAAGVQGQPGDEVENAIAANVKQIVERLKTASPVLAPFLESGELSVLGARYDLDEGKVQPLP